MEFKCELLNSPDKASPYNDAAIGSVIMPPGSFWESCGKPLVELPRRPQTEASWNARRAVHLLFFNDVATSVELIGAG